MLTILYKGVKKAVLACKRGSQSAMTRQSRGFTLIELMVVITVVAVLLTLAAPSYQKLIERNRLKEAAQSFKSDVQLARMEAIKRSRNTIFHRATTPGSAGEWCYGISTVPCVCDPLDNTVEDCDIKRIYGTSFPTVSLETDGDSTFDSRRGTSTDLSSLFTTRHYAVQVRVSNAGRVVICDPDPMPMDANGIPLQGIFGACN